MSFSSFPWLLRDLGGPVPDSGHKYPSRSAYPRDERLTLNGYEISHARGDGSFSNWSKKAAERMQNRTRRGVRRMNYQKITRQSILSSRTKKAGRGTGRKFTSRDLAVVPLPPALLSMRSHARCPEWRDTQKAARHRNYSGQSSLHAEAGAIFYSISSAGRDGCSGQRRKIAMKKRKTRVTPVVWKFSCQVPRDMGSARRLRYEKSAVEINREEPDGINDAVRESQFSGKTTQVTWRSIFYQYLAQVNPRPELAFNNWAESVGMFVSLRKRTASMTQERMTSRRLREGRACCGSGYTRAHVRRASRKVQWRIGAILSWRSGRADIYAVAYRVSCPASSLCMRPRATREGLR